MTPALLLAIIVVGPTVVLVALALLRRGSGAELLDWDPSNRIAARAAADVEDVERALEQHNSRRVAAGLEPEDEAAFARRIAREHRRSED